MKFNSILDVLGGFIILAMLTDIVTSKNSAGIVTSSGNAFSGILKAAQGK